MQHYHEQDRLQVALDCIIFGFKEDRLRLLLV